MASIRILAFGGLLPELNSHLKPQSAAQTAHNCLLTDGSLRPQAKWVQLGQYDSGFVAGIRGIAYDSNSDTAVMYASFDPVTLTGQPFASEVTVGASPNSIVNKYKTGAGLAASTHAVYGGGVSATVNYTRSFDSNKPVNRLYALTRVRRFNGYAEEGALIPVPNQDPTAVLYEGDLVTVEVNASALDDGANFIRIYRSITGLDTGLSVANEFDTDWYLVTEFPLLAGNLVSYVDGASATALPLDVNYSNTFHPHACVARYFGLTESGWFVVASVSGEINVSERFKHHAYPVENYFKVPAQINDIAIHMDSVYIGTNNFPYMLALSSGEKALQGDAVPYKEYLPCLPNTLTETYSGAMYASNDGVVAIGREGVQVVTKDIANPGDLLFSKEVVNGTASASIDKTSFGTYFAGKYIAFCEGPPVDDGFYLTTTIYPTEYSEGIDTAMAFYAGGSTNTILDLTITSAEFVSGVLRPLLQTYTIQPEAIESAMAWESGTLVTALKTYVNWENAGDGTGVGFNENLKTTGALIAGNLDDLLITNTMLPENLKTTGALIAGTLA